MGILLDYLNFSVACEYNYMKEKHVIPLTLGEWLWVYRMPVRGCAFRSWSRVLPFVPWLAELEKDYGEGSLGRDARWLNVYDELSIWERRWLQLIPWMDQGLVLESGTVDGLIDLVGTLRCVAGGGFYVGVKRKANPQKRNNNSWAYFSGFRLIMEWRAIK
jgi:hypothetical protein